MKRFDLAAGRIELGRARRDGGALVVDATPASYDTVFDYGDHGEFRPRAEVTSPESLATWEGLPLVVGHEWIAMANVSDRAIGYVRRAWDGNDGWLHAELVVVDGVAVADILSGDLAELSGGYSVDVVPERGKWRGDAFEGIQRNIQMNHLGIGPRFWARAGTNAKVR